MSLYSIDDQQHPITHIPHQAEYSTWKGRLSEEEIRAIFDRLHEIVDDSVQTGERVVTSSWMPGADWEGTAFYPIWEKACRYNFDQSGQCFGLFLWEHMINREDDWLFIKGDGEDIKGTIYFQPE